VRQLTVVKAKKKKSESLSSPRRKKKDESLDDPFVDPSYLKNAPASPPKKTDGKPESSDSDDE